MTRRGLLSIISSVYDPLGLAAQFLLQGRLLNQELCRANIGWNEVIPEKIQIQWTKWEKTETVGEDSSLKMLQAYVFWDISGM